jgi:hypothetical protein
VGLGAGASKFSELWFGTSVKFPTVFPGSSESRLMIACIFILFDDKVAIQWKNNLLITRIIFFSIGQSFIGCTLT